MLASCEYTIRRMHADDMPALYVLTKDELGYFDLKLAAFYDRLNYWVCRCRFWLGV